MVRASLLLLLSIMSLPLFAGPFGIDIGDMQDDSKFNNFSKLSDDTPNYLIGTNPPKAHSAFDKYLVQFSIASGACWIKGIGKDIESDSYGIRTKSAIDKIAGQISKKYGTSEKSDRLLPGSIWDDPDDWMTALDQNERFYLYEWSRETGATMADTGVRKILLVAQSSGGGDGYAILEFYLDNHDDCEREKSEREEDAF